MSNSQPLQIQNLVANTTDVVGTLPITCVLTWTDLNSPSAGVTVERTRSSDPSAETWILLAKLPAGVTSCLDVSLTFGGVYKYRVQALPVESVIFTPAKYAEILVTTVGEPPHVHIGSWPGSDNSGNANQAPEYIVTNGTH